MNLGPLFKERNGGTLAFRIRGVRSCAVLKTRHCGLDIHVCGHSLLQDPRDPAVPSQVGYDWTLQTHLDKQCLHTYRT